MQDILGRPVEEALSSLRAGEAPPPIRETVAPRRVDADMKGTLRIVACRKDGWIAARFLDGAPRENEGA